MKQITLFGTALVCSLLSCLEPAADPEIPLPEQGSPKTLANTSFQGLVEAYEQSEKEVLFFDATNQSVIEAFVISSDEGGNFYKSLVVQDHWTDPKMGLLIKIDLRSYYGRYQRGQKILISLAGLSIRLENGLYSLGYWKRQRLEPIPEGLLNEFIYVTDEWHEIDPRPMISSELDQSNLLTMVSLKEAQIVREEMGKTFSAERYDSYYAARVILDCSSDFELDLQTSTYADFKTMMLPDGKFEIQGILTTGRSDRLALEIISPEFMIPREGERCDPDYLNCENEGAYGSEVLFYEDFDDLPSTSALQERGWINKNINFRNEKFRKRSERGNTFMRISAYGSGELAMEAWLVSPPLDLEASQNEVLTFRTRATFQEGRALSVWVSPDYDADFGEPSWKRLDCELSDGTADGSNQTFVSSGKIGLSCLQGTIRIGFRYQGGDPGVSTTYDLDNFLLMGDARR